MGGGALDVGQAELFENADVAVGAVDVLEEELAARFEDAKDLGERASSAWFIGDVVNREA